MTTVVFILSPDTDFGENDFLICRQRYLDACVSYGNVPPQQRILRELERKTLSVAYRCLSARDIKPLCVALVVREITGADLWAVYTKESILSALCAQILCRSMSN